MDEKEVRIKHPSFGSVVVSRPSGNKSLFMSPYKHMHYVSLSIRKATFVQGGILQNRHYANDEIIEIDLSESQWAELVSSIGQGNGTPCTIARLDGKLVEPVPDLGLKEQYHNNLRASIEEKAQGFAKLRKDMGEILEKKGSLTKDDKARLISAIQGAERLFTDSAPFLAKMFTEFVEETISSAKIELSTHMNLVAQQAGLAQLEGHDPQLLLGQTSDPEPIKAEIEYTLPEIGDDE